MDDWNKYVEEYELKTWIDQWGDGPTAKLYYTHPSQDTVEDIRSKSDIPVISEEEANTLMAYNQRRHREIRERLLEAEDESQESIPTVIFFQELEFKKFEKKGLIKDLK